VFPERRGNLAVDIAIHALHIVERARRVAREKWLAAQGSDAKTQQLVKRSFEAVARSREILDRLSASVSE